MINLLARLGLDTSGFATALARADILAAKAGAKIGSALKNQFSRFFGVDAIGAAIKNVIEYGGRITDMSEKSSISKRALQEFDYIASQTGATIEEFVTAEKKLAQAQIAAIGGSKEMADVFARMGLSVDDLKRLDPHQLFMLVSGAIGKAGKTSQTLSDTLKLMGRSADTLLPAMRQGFDAMAERAHKLGLILSNEVIDKMDEAGDRLSEAGLRARPIAASLAMGGVGVAEELGAVISGFAEVFNSFKQNPIKTIFADSSSFSRGVEQYNQQILDSVGSKSLVPLLQKQNEKLAEIAANTKEGGNEFGL